MANARARILIHTYTQIGDKFIEREDLVKESGGPRGSFRNLFIFIDLFRHLNLMIIAILGIA